MRSMREMYCIGDIQGCAEAFDDLLDVLGFSPSRHTLYVLGDLVNRGPDSAGVLRTMMRHEGSIHCLLGNHDIHLLAVYCGVRQMGRRDTLTDLLCAPDADRMIEWLRHQPLARWSRDCLMVHAGVQPDWTVQDTLAHAAEISGALSGPDWKRFLAGVFGNSPTRWSPALTGMDRLRVILNTLTRIRFLEVDGSMDFAHNRGLDEAPPELVPWFAHPLRRTADALVAFGHWSALGLVVRHNLLALDTGCVWGGQLTAASILPRGRVGEVVQVDSRSRAAP